MRNAKYRQNFCHLLVILNVSGEMEEEEEDILFVPVFSQCQLYIQTRLCVFEMADRYRDASLFINSLINVKPSISGFRIGMTVLRGG